MYLKRLSANKEQFHTIEFKDGLNFIVGKRENPSVNDLKNTYNGVGKSLIIELIHFCFGSSKIDVFEEKLSDWIFTLEFKINEKTFKVSRSCSEQKKVVLNGKELSIGKYTSLLQNEVFGIDENSKISNLTFRSLISRFVRRYKSSYTKYETYISKETDYGRLVNNAFLLGIDPKIIENKMKQKKELDELERNKKSVEKDPILKEYFVGNDDLDIEITDIRDQIKDLEAKISEFKVAENYTDIQKQADEISYKKKEISNQIILIENSLRKINKSLNIKADVELDNILKMYDEAKVVFGDKVTKQLEEVTSFHEKLLSSRKRRLEAQRKSLESQKFDLESKIKEYSNELDSLLKFLGNHGALDEYTVLTDKLSELKLRLEKADDYKNLLETYKSKLVEANINMEQQKLEATKYLKDNKELLEKIMNTFRTYSKIFYKDKPSGLDIKVNDGENQLRFDIKAKIIGDSSDGISEVCIFCFDMTLLKLKNHNVNFMFHDSRIFANMDSRQRLSLIKIAEEETNKSKIQYIASMNEDNIFSLKDVTDQEGFDYYKNLIEENTILVLTDKSDEDKLLGMQIDLPYDK